MIRVVKQALSLAVLIGAVHPALAAERPVVVELFTSQGCSSCPPADAMLGQLTKQPGLLPLAFHVDYWNRLGWKDPYSIAEATARQRAYSHAMSLSSVYTPQMVIDGRYDAVGSDRRAVTRGIASAAKTTASVPLHILREGDTLHLSVGSGEPASGSLWIVGYDHRHTTRIGAGENGGRTLTEFNVVRKFEQLGNWQGAAMQLDVSLAKLDGAEAVALLLQSPDGGVLGATALDLGPTN
jgi:hypothetical protein